LAPRIYHHLVVSLPGGGRTVVNTKLDLTCGGFAIDPLGVRQPPLHAWYTPLMIRVSVPATVEAGTTLRYAVTLSNPTKSAIRIDPCPAYIETATGVGVHVLKTYALDCDRVREIPASRQVRYEMRLPIPTAAPSGVIVVAWFIDGPESTPSPAKLRVQNNRRHSTESK
jgi:hypothetical protein